MNKPPYRKHPPRFFEESLVPKSWTVGCFLAGMIYLLVFAVVVGVIGFVAYHSIAKSW